MVRWGAGMRRWAAFGALCVFLALLASPGGTIEPNHWHSVPISMGDAVPRDKPDRNAMLPEGVEVVRQCEASTMLMRVIPNTDVRLYFARYSRSAFDEMVGAGCTRIQQGCNTCTVQYVGCTAGERAACGTPECLEKVCKQRMVCTTRRCTAQAMAAPPCDARFARQACLDPLDTDTQPRE